MIWIVKILKMNTTIMMRMKAVLQSTRIAIIVQIFYFIYSCVWIYLSYRRIQGNV